MTARLHLIGFATCPWVQRSAIVLREKGIDYKVTNIDSENRPDWFLAISPHAKVPVLQVDGHNLFESNAINEYLEETYAPRLHPADPFERALNRAWTDYLPTFANAITNTSYADDEDEYQRHRKTIPQRFAKVEAALAARTHDGPYFNGKAFSLVDAGYAPFLQRYMFLDRIRPMGFIDQFPRLTAWRDALLARPSVRASTVPDLESIYRANLRYRKLWIAGFLDGAQAVAAE